ncbi:MAG: DUF1648 domain-containing protein [Reichenbachiella sp.]|uniref:DUF1648 domain-containing protein n=1 Tax=Reichenbachiella sp. TaxID=2184521 RepID=UPI0032669346
MERPKINIKLDFSDYIIEIIGAVFIILMIGWPLYFFNELPDAIPRHFNAAGEPDRFSQKNTIWSMPALGLFSYISMFILNKFPHIFNYPKEITEENAERQYRIATKLIRTLNMLISASFFYISIRTIQTALNEQDGLGIFFLPIFLLTIFGTIGIYMYQALKK